jgi:ribulose 1,5-bisphosphate synthetase/thiazole synthase
MFRWFDKVLKDKMDPLGIECTIVETITGHENVAFEIVKRHLKPE